MQDLSQAMVKLSCVTDDTCGSVNNTLQGGQSSSVAAITASIIQGSGLGPA